MAALTVQTIVNAGTAPSFAATASASDTVPVGNGHDTFVVYKNSTGAPLSVVIEVPGTTDYGALLPDPSIAVPANGEVWIPLRKEFRAIDGSGRATITAVTPTGLTVAVVRLG